VKRRELDSEVWFHRTDRGPALEGDGHVGQREVIVGFAPQPDTDHALCVAGGEQERPIDDSPRIRRRWRRQLDRNL
jgi:hypothetical protein